MRLSPPDDDFQLSNAYARFHLSNGEVVYDLKETVGNPFWLQLQDYLRQKNLRIDNVVLKFRSNEVHYRLHPTDKYLYYSYGATRDIANDWTDEFYILGKFDSSGFVRCTWYKAPELIEHKSLYKEFEEAQDSKRLFLMPQP
jgi:hypothetical protein